MNCCLIIPPSPFLLDERVFMSLGVLKVAAFLEQHNHKVDILDLSGVKDYLQATKDYQWGRGSDVAWFGLTATTPQLPAAVKISDELTGWVVLGGPHVTLLNAAAKNGSSRAQLAMERLYRSFDVVVAGDGEKAIEKAFDIAAPRLIDADDPKSDLWLALGQLDKAPYPARHLVDFESYHYRIDEHRATSIIGQLGCPFGCNFCGGRLSPMLRRARSRSITSVVEEMRMLYETYGVTGFMFYDDELNVNKEMVGLMQAIVQLQEDVGAELALRGFVKAELLTDEQAHWMRRAGFKWVLCGFESGSERILTNINKKATRADNDRAMEICRRAGIKVKALMSIGHPGESEQTVKETEEWLLEQRPNDFDATVITVYPGTPYYDYAKRVVDLPGSENVWCFEVNGDRLYHYDLDFTKEQAFYKGVPGEYKAYVFTDYMTSGELVKARDEMERNVRGRLGLSYPGTGQGVQFEHSMGQQ